MYNMFSDQSIEQFILSIDFQYTVYTTCLVHGVTSLWSEKTVHY